MNTPLLVRTYDSRGPSPSPSRRPRRVETLPPVASFTFAEILRSSDSPEFQSAIDGIAEICAKNHMSMADEYASHLPPLGEITAANSTASHPHHHRPGMRRALTSVPEASSSSSEGSNRSKKRKGSFFSFGRRGLGPGPMKTMRIGSMGRAMPVDATTALIFDPAPFSNLSHDAQTRRSILDSGRINDRSRHMTLAQTNSSRAVSSLQQFLDSDVRPEQRP